MTGSTFLALAGPLDLKFDDGYSNASLETHGQRRNSRTI